MRLGNDGGEAPPWAAIGAVAVGALIIGVIVWRTMFVSPLDAGPPKAVRPGMYDLRAEVRKAQAAQPGPSAPGVAPGMQAPPAPGMPPGPPPGPGQAPPPSRDPSGF